MRNPWIIAQLAVAAVLLALSLLGIIGIVVFNLPELAFSFAGGIQAFAVFPGLVLSLIVNALIMRLAPGHRAQHAREGAAHHRVRADRGRCSWFHFYTDDDGYTFGFAIIAWPIVIRSPSRS